MPNTRPIPQGSHLGDGPSLEQYVETRFNLVKEAAKTSDEAMRERIYSVIGTAVEFAKTVDVRFKHQEEITRLLKEAADTAAQKAEDAQHAHNVASNEWRKTVQDFKDQTTSRTEFNRLDAAFAAYKLEIATTVAARQLSEAGRREGSQETKGEARAGVGMIISIAVAASTIVALVVGYLRPVPQTQQMQVPPGYVLVPAPTATK